MSTRGGSKSNWPLDRARAVPGSGEYVEPSITVYSRTASGDAAPVAVIQGPKTRLNWPAGMAVVPERGELFVANDTGHSILVFRETDRGDVAPIRVIEGPRTSIKNPIGVAVDVKNGELWVANFGNHAGTVYPLDADGDTPPLRTIRAAPLGKEALGIGNPGAVALDSKRDELLVPN
jgi:DNA-binding beta-propeller fold protein YncE